MTAADTLEAHMRTAIREAEQSLREGNHGFGALVARDGEALCAAHDTDETDSDPTAHAELKAIRGAASRIGKDLSSCTLVCTHEPCPMCAGAAAWARVGRVVYGFGIDDAVAQGRDRIRMGCEEVFSRSGQRIQVVTGVLGGQCAALYDRSVRSEIRRLRHATGAALHEHDVLVGHGRREWYRAEGHRLFAEEPDPLLRAYRVLLAKLGVTEGEAPIVERDARRLVFASGNFCPTLEACRILGLDTRTVCGMSTEGATDALVREVDPRLHFRRNYGNLRPHAARCEEIIEYGA